MVRRFLSLLGLACLFSGVAQAQTAVYWAGIGGDSNFSTLLNWALVDVPATNGTSLVIMDPTGLHLEFPLLTLGGTTITTSSSVNLAGLQFIDVTGGSASVTGTGQVELQASGITISATAVSIANPVALGHAQTWSLSGSSSLTLSSSVSGSGALTINNLDSGSTVTLDGSNTYSGGTTLSGGTLVISNGQSLGTGSLAVTSASTLSTPGGFTLGTNISVPAAGLTITGLESTLTLSGAITNSGSDEGQLILNGGTYALGATNTYSGGTTLIGTNTVVDVSVQGSNSESLGTGTVIANGSNTPTLSAAGASGPVSLTNAIQVSSTGLVLNTSGAPQIIVDGVISDLTSGGFLDIEGAVELTHTNTYSGGTELGDGAVVTIDSGAAFGSGALYVGGVDNAPTIIPTGGALSVGNAIYVSGSGLVLGSEGVSDLLTLSGVVSNNGSCGILYVAGPVELTNSNNTYSGGTVLEQGGTLYVTSGATLGNSGATLGSGGISVGDSSQPTLAVAGSHSVEVDNAITLGTGGIILNTPDSPGLTIGSSISGPGAVTIDGSVTFLASDCYTGGTILEDSSILYLATNHALGSGTVIADATSSAPNLTTLPSGGPVTLWNNIQVSSAGLGLNGYGGSLLTLDGTISDLTVAQGSLTIGGGAYSGGVVLGGVNTYSGGTTLYSGALYVTNNSSLGTGALTVDSITLCGYGPASLIVSSESCGPVTLSNDILLTSTGLILNQNSSPGLTLTGIISDVDDSDAGTLYIQGPVELDGANTYSGSTILSTGAILTVGNSSALGTSTVDVEPSEGLPEIISSAQHVHLGNAIVLEGQALSLNSDGLYRLTLSGIISDEIGLDPCYLPNDQLYIDGPVKLTGANTYSGGTTLDQGGALYVGNNSALGSGVLTIEQVYCASPQILAASGQSVDLDNPIELSNSGLSLNPDSHHLLTLSGDIQDSSDDGTLYIDGRVNLTGSNSYSGNTYLDSGGYLYVGNDNALGSSTVVTEEADHAETLAASSEVSVWNPIEVSSTGLKLNHPWSPLLTLAGQISDADCSGGVLYIDGPVDLTACNTYSGGTYLNAGAVLGVGNDYALGEGAITVNEVANSDYAPVLNADGRCITLSNDIYLAHSGLTLNPDSCYTLTLSGEISDLNCTTAGVLNVSGTVELSGENTYSGGTNLSGGKVYVTNSQSLGTGALSVDENGGSLIAAGGSCPITIANGIVISAAGLSLNHSSDDPELILTGTISDLGTDHGVLNVNGNVELDGDNTYSGTTYLNNGATLYVGSSTALGTSVLSIDSFCSTPSLVATRAHLNLGNDIYLDGAGLALNPNGTYRLTLSGVISDSGDDNGLLIEGPVRLSGDNTYSSNTYLDSSGALYVANDNALGTGSLYVEEADSAQVLAASHESVDLANDIYVTQTGLSLNPDSHHLLTLSGSINDYDCYSGVLYIDGRVNLTGDNTYSGNTYLDSGGYLYVGNDNALGTGTLITEEADHPETLSASAAVTISNAIEVSDTGLRLNRHSSDLLTLSGQISDADCTGGALYIDGPVDLTACNTYSGGTYLNAGAVLGVGNDNALGEGAITANQVNNADYVPVLNASGPCITLSNDIYLSHSGLTLNPDSSYKLTLAGEISDLNCTTAGVLNVNGVVALTGGNTYSGGTNLSGGTVYVTNSQSIGTGALTVGENGGSLIVASGSDPVTLSNDIAISATGLSLNHSSEDPELILTGVISDFGSDHGVLNIYETVELDGANTYSGGTFLNAGAVLGVGNTSALGLGALTANQVGNTDPVPVLNASGPCITLNNNIYLAHSGLTLNPDSSYKLTLTGNINDLNGSTHGVLNVNGLVDLEDSGNYSGGTNFSGATATIGTDSALGSGAIYAVNSTLDFTASAAQVPEDSDFESTTATFENTVVITDLEFNNSTLNFNGSQATLIDPVSDAVDSSNEINLNTGTQLTLEASSENSAGVFYHGQINGEGSVVTESAPGNVVGLGGDSTYSGGTTVGSGVLIVTNSSALGSGSVTVNPSTTLAIESTITAPVTISNPVTVSDGGSLAGYGTFDNGQTFTIQNGTTITGGSGFISPSNFAAGVIPGTLTFGSTSPLVLGGGGNLLFSVADAGGSVGSGYSTIDANGGVSITATSSSPFTIDLYSVSPGGTQAGLAANFDPTQSYAWTLVTSPSAISGFDPSDFTFNTANFQNSLGAGGQFFVTDTGTQLELNFTPVPEPSTWALMAGGLCALGGALRRRRR